MLSDLAWLQRLVGMDKTTRHLRTDLDHRLDAAREATPTGHWNTLLGERRAGSTWGRHFDEGDWWELLDCWKIFTPPPSVAQPGCTYLRAPIADLFPRATLGALSWEALSREERGRVVVHAGAHGPELGLFVARGTPRPQATTATLILGLHEGRECVFTLHPGEPLRPGIERSGRTAVKLVELP